MNDNSEFLSILLTILLFVLFIAGGVLYHFFAKAFRYGQIRKTFEDLVQNDGFQAVVPGDPFIGQLTQRFRAFDDPILSNITINIREAAFKKIGDLDVCLNYYEWEKSRTFLTHSRGREYRETEVELHLRAGVYIPVELSIPRMFIRGRLDPAEEDKMELTQGIPTPPEKGIPDFDRFFVCKGPSSTVVSRLFTLEVQKAILSHAGNFPLIPGDFRHLMIYFNEHGMNVTMEKLITGNEMRALLEFALMLHGEIKKTLKPSGEGEEDVYKAPDI